MTHGRFVWYDLMTPDPERARAFYTALFGWETVDHPMPEGTYTIWQLGDRKLGGMVRMDPEEGVPPHWMPYVSVAGLGGALEKAKALGAKQVTPAMSAPEVGRWAVISDPQGGYITPFEPAPEMPLPPEGEHGMQPPGAFCWAELNSTDPDGSVRFYSGLFPWRVDSVSMGEFGTYHLLYADREQVGGIGPVQGPPVTYWLSYVHVTDVDATAKRAGELGGKVLHGPDDFPEVGRFAVVEDPTCAVLALFKSVRS